MARADAWDRLGGMVQEKELTERRVQLDTAGAPRFSTFSFEVMKPAWEHLSAVGSRQRGRRVRSGRAAAVHLGVASGQAGAAGMRAAPACSPRI